MTYSKLIHIEAQKTKIMYNFTFNKTFSFRFLTPEFPNGIKLNTESFNMSVAASIFLYVTSAKKSD